MNPTQAQIRNLNTQEKQQMRRYTQSLFRRIMKHNQKAKDQCEREQDVNSRPNNSNNETGLH